MCKGAVKRKRKTCLPMDVILSMRGDVKVKYDIHVRNVQPSRSDISGNQNVPLTGFKFVQGAQSLGLR